MAKIIFGNHSSVIVPRQDRDSIRNFYRDVLGGKITKAEDYRDFVRLGEKFYIVFLYGDVPDESEFLRTARSVWLEIKSDNVEEMRRKILESGLVRKLEIPDPHLSKCYLRPPVGEACYQLGLTELKVGKTREAYQTLATAMKLVNWQGPNRDHGRFLPGGGAGVGIGTEPMVKTASGFSLGDSRTSIRPGYRSLFSIRYLE
jgi:hypothetical protein